MQFYFLKFICFLFVFDINALTISNNALQQPLTASTNPSLLCVDSDLKCSLWASQGECQSNAVW